MLIPLSSFLSTYLKLTYLIRISNKKIRMKICHLSSWNKINYLPKLPIYERVGIRLSSLSLAVISFKMSGALNYNSCTDIFYVDREWIFYSFVTLLLLFLFNVCLNIKYKTKSTLLNHLSRHNIFTFQIFYFFSCM